MITYETPGGVNTDATLKLAMDTARERGLDLVLASSTGETALKLAKLAEEEAFPNKIVVVRHVYGMEEPGVNDMPEAIAQSLRAHGITLVTAAHALSGGERGVSKKFGGVSPVEVMAATLRMFGQGVKVCVEIAIMALDCGAVPYGKPVVAGGGTAYGSDAACIVTPNYTANLLDTKIHEILCKPHL